MRENYGVVDPERVGDNFCPKCGAARLIWPISQDVSSWSDPKVKWVHSRGTGPEECV